MFEYVPLSLMYVLMGMFGAIIGSFLNVYLYRFHTGKSLGGSSHCLSCGTGLRWYELFPRVSFIVLRGRCRTCSSFIPFRYALVEFATALGFILAYMVSVDVISLGLHLFLVTVLILIVVYDLYHMIIPDEFVIMLSLIAISFMGYAMYLRPQYEYYGTLAIASLAASSFFALLWGVSKGRWLGFGDVKLILPLAFMTTPATVFSLVVLSFWLGAIISLGYVGVQFLRKKKFHAHTSKAISLKSEIPFAPFLVLAFLLVHFFEVDILKLLEQLYAL